MGGGQGARTYRPGDPAVDRIDRRVHDVDMAGYSGTPLAKKLGIKAGHMVSAHHAPASLAALLDPLPEGAQLVGPADGADLVLAFYTERAMLEGEISSLSASIFPDRGLWLCWPKKSSGVATDLTGDVIRAEGLGAGVVDIKVCAIDDTWSGHRFAHRMANR